MRTKLIIVLGAAALALAACGGSSGSDGSSAGRSSPDAGAGAEAPGPGTVSEAETDLGRVLVDGDGLTLYGLTDDTDGVSTCVGPCADAWPPVAIESAELPAGLDPTLFKVVARSDGTFQLQAGEWPLYRFAGDAAPGDTNGQGSAGIWFAVAPDGSLVTGDAAGPAARSDGGY